MKMHRPVPALLAVILLAFGASAAHAGWIKEILNTDYQDRAPTYPGTNNDNYSRASSNPNKAYYDVYFDAHTRDVRFHVVNSGGTAEYTVYFSVTNQTGNPWHAFEMGLGFYEGAAFVPCAVPDLDFDSPHRDSIVTLVADSNLGWLPASISWTGLEFASDGSELCRFSIDVPDLAAGTPGVETTSDGYWFTIRATGISPEPGTLALLVLPVAALVARRRSAA